MAAKRLKFTFEGREVTARSGQSLAGALHANGVSILSRSPKYHRPRGYTCGFSACGNCPLTVDGMPGVLACAAPVCGGEDVRREQGFPGTGIDLIRAADLAKPLLPAGFQFRLFTKNPRLSSLAGKFMAVLAGGGRMPSPSAAASATVTKVVRQAAAVMVVGGGPSGLATALGAAEAGQDVVVVDRAFDGGRALVRTEPIHDAGKVVGDIREHFARLLESARKHGNITLITGTAAGLLDGVVPVIAGRVRYEIEPERVVVATGCYEVPALFANNDRPGVMLADAAVKLAEIEATPPGRRIVIATDSERGHDVARRLAAAGCRVTAVVDSRASGGRPAEGWEVLTELRPSKAHGWSRVRAVSFTGSTGPLRLPGDTLVLAYGRRRSEEFALHTAYAAAGSHLDVTDDNPDLPDAHLVVGTATGEMTYDTTELRRQSRTRFGPDPTTHSHAAMADRTYEGDTDAQA